MNGVTLLMVGLKQHETCSLIGQFGLNLIHHSLIFVFCGYITWWLVFIILPPAGPSHMELSKTVCSDIGPLRRRLWNPARFLWMCVSACTCFCVRVCVRMCVTSQEQWLAALSLGEQLCMLFVFLEGKCSLSPSSGEQHELAIASPRVCLCVHLSQKRVIK